MDFTSTQAATELEITVWQFLRKANKAGMTPTRLIGNSRMWARSDVENLKHENASMRNAVHMQDSHGQQQAP